MQAQKSTSGVAFHYIPLQLFLLYLILSTTADDSVDSNVLVVSLTTGKVRGTVGTSYFTGKAFHQFRGIPYAQPPVGELRFRAPLPAESWEGILDGTDYGSKCLQLNDTQHPLGQEDCLFVNVFTPSIEKKGALPVLVLIHGGSFQLEGGDSYSPDYWLEEDVVFVTFNYRLGILGFLSTGQDPTIQGNAGLKDQVLALKWVQDNIRNFNGDPSRVTLLGISSGAVSTHLHMLSPMSQGLFSQVISQSGTALCPWAIVRKPELRVEKLAKLTNCTNESPKLVKECLLLLSGEQIVEQQPAFAEWFIDPIVPVGPVVESENGEEPQFLSAFPYKLIQEGKFSKDVPWILGVNSHEGLLHAADIAHFPILSQVINFEWDQAAPITLLFKHTTFNPNGTSAAIRTFYFGEQDINRKMVDKLIEMYSDRYFFHGTHHAAKSHVANGATAPVYLYYFDHIGENTITTMTLEFNKRLKGVCHYDQVQYLFTLEGFPEIGDGQFEFAHKFRKSLLNFINGGKPGEPAWRTVEEADVTEGGSLHYNVLGSGDEPIPEPFTDRLKFWDKLGLLELDREIDEAFIQSLLAKSEQNKNEAPKVEL